MNLGRITALVFVSLIGMDVHAANYVNPIYGNERNDGQSERAPRRAGAITMSAQLKKKLRKQLRLQRARFAHMAPAPRLGVLEPVYLLGTEQLSKWSAAGSDLWQTDLSARPIAIRSDTRWLPRGFNPERLTDQQYYWSPDKLILKDQTGNPDQTGKKISALLGNDGWSMTAGDFNGDGWNDVATGSPTASRSDTATGEVHVFWGGKTVATLPSQVLPGNDNEGIGMQVASAGDVNKDGYDDLLTATNWGVNKVYLYLGSSAGLVQTPQALTPPTDRAEYGFGHGIASHHGDLNNDGYADVVIAGGGSPGYVAVYYGNSGGVSSAADAVIDYPDSGGFISPSIVGDTNGDKVDDLAVAVGQEQLPATAFNVYVYHGGPNGLEVHTPQAASVALPSADAVYRNGTVAPAGDVNSDGYADLLVGNEWAGGSFDMQGEAYVFYGSPQGIGSNPDMTIKNPDPSYNARFGTSLNAIGDFNRDSAHDIAIGAPYRISNGAVYIYSGGRTFDASPDAMLTDAEGSFGWSIASVGRLQPKRNNYLAIGAEFGGVLVYRGGKLPARP